MPFKYISDLSRDDSTVKLIFDHFRNIGIFSVVALAAAWKFKNVSPSGWQYFLDITSASVLATCAFALYFLNYEHFLNRLSASPHRKVLKVAVIVFYAVVASGLLTYLSRSNA